MIGQAILIAKNDLRACYGEEGIFAGLHQFMDYWARDSFFASFGASAIGDHLQVKKNLELFLVAMNKSGMLPLRVGKSTAGVALSYLGLQSKNCKRVPIYAVDKSMVPPIDSNPLIVISAYEYFRITHDKEFLSKHLDKLERAILWMDRHLQSGLVFEEGFSNWADSVNKRGHVLYTNVCYAHALKCLSDLFRHVSSSKSKHYLAAHEEVKKRINHEFWTGEFYLDWYEGRRHHNYFSTDGNMLAVIWGIADNARSRHIEEAANIFGLEEVPSGCVNEKYPSSLISWHVKAVGIPDYHSGLSWLWLGAICALAKHKLGMHKEASAVLQNMSGLIVKHGKVYEVYTKEGKPVDRLIYKAENPFAWSSGMFLYAASVCGYSVQ